MAFSNQWDQTFPPDTQLANLLGQDIRNGVKVDVRERMAAISGLDAAKPAFSGDAQPANWNGVLFFATDTGKIYQWVNPAWIEVTASFKTTTNVVYKNNVPIVHTGTVTLDTVYTVSIGPLTSGSLLRVTLDFIPNFGTPSDTLDVSFGGVSLNNSTLNIGAGLGGALCRVIILGGNNGATNLQRWDGQLVPTGGSPSISGFVFIRTTGVDTTIAQNLVVKYQNSVAGNTQTFERLLVEQF